MPAKPQTKDSGFPSTTQHNCRVRNKDKFAQKTALFAACSASSETVQLSGGLLKNHFFAFYDFLISENDALK